MSRKTRLASVAALAATTSFTIASAEGSGANAQVGENLQISGPELTEEVVPVFVQKEVIQPLPESGAAEPQALASADTLHELVARMPDQTGLSREMECLAGAIYFESRGEPLAGQLAVAQVVINRADSGLFPSDYCGVVFQRAQFSFVKGGTMPYIPRGTAAWQRAKAVARIAHEGLWESEAADSLYFHATYVRPSWSRSKQARATIDTHVFYR
ncbi:cell wall hydrolase [Pelagerythrobacter rhizovicinus]|uniref:Cell wall hydrolase n=1 Tax=Pelagerythrobacter rhizovicinus TaxID=2268576 RepID=A0A4Q2KJX5_9SPHN|nr:cell wall hydrolase [Pelagerythrobacter rhizovicinus]RXZ64689.1 cell wall hydrolase [Pelagerythrobacter rhizovicinus]